MKAIKDMVEQGLSSKEILGNVEAEVNRLQKLKEENDKAKAAAVELQKKKDAVKAESAKQLTKDLFSYLVATNSVDVKELKDEDFKEVEKFFMNLKVSVSRNPSTKKLTFTSATDDNYSWFNTMKYLLW